MPAPTEVARSNHVPLLDSVDRPRASNTSELDSALAEGLDARVQMTAAGKDGAMGAVDVVVHPIRDTAAVLQEYLLGRLVPLAEFLARWGHAAAHVAGTATLGPHAA